jgi:hypothetical protein
VPSTGPTIFWPAPTATATRSGNSFHGTRAAGPCLSILAPRDPCTHLELVLSTGIYEALTPRGDITIKVFGLNRADLARGRAFAFIRTVCMLRDRARLLQFSGTEEAGEVAASLLDQPFADVLYAMLRYRDLPGAEQVLRGRDVVDALADPALHFWP